jgi:hypothetical protein
VAGCWNFLLIGHKTEFKAIQNRINKALLKAKGTAIEDTAKLKFGQKM